jgi:hypothetical protein
MAIAKHGIRQMRAWEWLPVLRLSECLGLQYDKSDDVGGT